MKYLACIFTLIGFLGNGVWYYRSLRKKYLEKVYLMKLFELLKQETIVTKASFPSVCLDCSRRMKSGYKEIFEHFAKELNRGEGELKVLWDELVLNLTKQAGLDKEEQLILKQMIPENSFGLGFSFSDSISLTLSDWEMRIHDAKEEMKRNGKVAVTLNLSAGFILCLIVW